MFLILLFEFDRLFFFLNFHFWLLRILILLIFPLPNRRVYNIFMRPLPSDIRSCFSRYNNIIVHIQSWFMCILLNSTGFILAAVHHPALIFIEGRSFLYWRWSIWNGNSSWVIFHNLLALLISKTGLYMVLLN